MNRFKLWSVRPTLMPYHLAQEEAGEYKEETKLRELVAQYSEFINFPIYLWTTKETEVEVPDEDAQQEAADSKADDVEDEGAPAAWPALALM